MRSTNVFALFLLCSPLLAACSGTGQTGNALPAVGVPMAANNGSENAPQAAANAVLPGAAGTSAPAAAAVAAARTSAAAAFAFPGDFPANAVSGALQRITSSQWDQPASSPTVALDGPGSNGARTSTYTRTDGSSSVAVYYPSGVPVATGWLGVKLGEQDRLPLMSTADDRGTWTDTRPGFKASATFYFTPTRVLLIALAGSGSKASPAPSPSGAPRPSASPGATISPGSESSCTHFVSNPACHALPAHPNVSPYSSAWASLEFQAGRAYIPSFNAKAGSHPFYDSADNSDPPLDELTSRGSSVPHTIACDLASWGAWACTHYGIEGKVVNFPAGMEPSGNSDHHYSFSDDAARGEYDFWLVKQLPGGAGTTLHAGSGGFCSWSGDGTACSGSNATNIAGSLGSVSEADFARGEADAQHGSFGHAIALTALCSDPSYVYPANASDGANTNGFAACNGHTGSRQRPPEGTRLFLNLSDAQVDAMQLPAYAKTFWRTLDREHEGGFINDSGWSGGPGLSPAMRRDDFSAQAREAGVDPVPYARVPIGSGTIDFARDISFCANGSC